MPVRLDFEGKMQFLQESRENDSFTLELRHCSPTIFVRRVVCRGNRCILRSGDWYLIPICIVQKREDLQDIMHELQKKMLVSFHEHLRAGIADPMPAQLT